MTALGVVAGFALASFPLGELAKPISDELQRNEPALRLDANATAAGDALFTAMLGGFRTVAADLAWLWAAEAVDDRDAATTETMLGWTTMLDPRSLYFWLNGARILAYDLPEWQWANIGRAGRTGDMHVRASERQAGMRALRWLDQATTSHPDSAAVWIERANIELNRLRDLDAAALSYRRAWEQPHAPYYAARLHGELLRRAGHKAAALSWLVRLYPQLPPGDEAAAADLVLARIRQLERELGVPPKQAYRPLTLNPPRPFLHPC